MKKKGRLLLLLLFIGLIAGGCVSQNTNYSLSVIPPQNDLSPLQGTWEIIAPLPEISDANQELSQKWAGKTLHFSDKYVLLNEYLINNPHYQAKKVDSEAYLFYHHQAFPENFYFEKEEIMVLTLFDNHLFFCEFIQEEKDILLLNLLNNCYLARKISDTVDETIFSSFKAADKETSIPEANSLTETTGSQTGVLLGLRAPGRQEHTAERYRTLWLATTGQILEPPLELETLLFPRRSGFYQLEVIGKKEGEKEEDFPVVNSILKKEEDNPPELTLNPDNWEGKEGYINRRILYLGNDYLSIEEKVKQASANNGSLEEKSRLQIYAIDSLPGIKAVKISDLTDSSALTAMEDGEQKLRRQLGLEQTELQDETNFGLVRKMGYWIFNGRINYLKKEAAEKTAANEKRSGTISGEETFEKADYHLTIIPPDHLVCHNKLDIPWTRVKNHVPSAIDVFTSPAKDLALVVTNNEIIVYKMGRENLVDPPLGKISLNKDEEIIMAEWALGHYVEDWTLTLTNQRDGGFGW
jgi:hypothetical protein